MNTITKDRSQARNWRPHRQALLFAFTLAALTWPSWQRAQAWNWIGLRWGTTPTSGCCLNLTHQSFGTGDFWDDNDYYAFANGYDSWTHSSHSASNVQWSSGTNSNIEVSDFSDPNDGDDGVTDMNDDGNGHFTQTFSFLNIAWTESYDWHKRQGVATHELGHSVGLDDRSTGCEIMISDSFDRWDACGIFTPATDDYAGVDSHY